MRFAAFTLAVFPAFALASAAQLGHSNRLVELGEHAHHLEHGLARRRRGVDALLMQE
jgi:hypothetical protein